MLHVQARVYRSSRKGFGKKGCLLPGIDEAFSCRRLEVGCKSSLLLLLLPCFLPSSPSQKGLDERHNHAMASPLHAPRPVSKTRVPSGVFLWLRAWFHKRDRPATFETCMRWPTTGWFRPAAQARKSRWQPMPGAVLSSRPRVSKKAQEADTRRSQGLRFWLGQVS